MLLYIAAAVAFALSLVLTYVSRFLGLQGVVLLAVRLVLILLGLAIAGVLIWYQQRRKKQVNSPGGETVDTAPVDELLRQADRRLASSPQTGVKRFRDLPVLYVLGESGSAKTTAVAKSGLEPELLAGEVYREKLVVPTAVANLWYSRSTALLEVGDAVRKTPALWKHLVTATRPRALAAMRRQAPFRAAVVCISCEQFMGAQTTETMQAAASPLNAQLRELARQLGATVPVYALLTKLDRVPGFTEYVRNLSPEEGNILLGAAPQSTGKATEEALAAITSSVDSVLFSLGEARLDLLARESDPQKVSAAYQFPRELRRFRNLLTTFLAELNRASQLSSNPDLRSFALTGVRPIIVQQIAAAPQSFAPAPQNASDATGVFRAPQPSAPQPLAMPSVHGEKIAQWAFLARFFPDLVLGDSHALGGTRQTGSGRLLMRVIYSSLAAVLLLYLCLLTVSYFANAALQGRIEAASSVLAQTSASGSPPQTAQLKALDEVRTSLAELETYHAEGAPLHIRWGLYRGDTLLQPTRALYFTQFRNLLLTRTQNEMVAGMNALPATSAPASDYNTTYSTLRAYLITTSNPEKSTVDFLPPVLLGHLRKTGAALSPEDSTLAQRQFEYYARVLPSQHLFAMQPAAAAVSHARGYLASFGSFERIYQSVVNAAEKSAPALRFSTQYPNAEGVLDEPHVIPGAYTKPGFGFMQDALAHPDRYFSGEAWVLGEQAPQSIDTATLKTQLSARYVSDYLAQWRAFLKEAEVVRFANLQDAAKKLGVLSKNDSPLLALLYTVSRNTAVENAEIATSFQAPQSFVPPGNADQYIDKPNKPYVDGLLALSTAVGQAAGGPPDPASAAAVATAAGAARLAAQQAAQAFRIDSKGHVDSTTLALLEQPVTAAETLARGFGPAQANAGGKSFCSTYNGLMAKAPFNPRAAAQATPAEVTALLQPGTGLLWQFYDANLKTLLVQQGTGYVIAPKAPIAVNPGFLKFFNRLAAVSQTLFPADAKDPQLAFSLRNLPSGGVQNSSFKVDGQALTNSDSSKPFTWNAATAKEASLTANGLPLLFNGPWAVFELVNKAHVQKAAAGYDLSFPLELANTPVKAPDGTPVVVRYELSGAGADILAPGALAGLRCVGEVSN